MLYWQCFKEAKFGSMEALFDLIEMIFFASIGAYGYVGSGWIVARQHGASFRHGRMGLH
jgi:hypothetical protein